MSVRVCFCLGFVFLSWLDEWLLSVGHYSIRGHSDQDKKKDKGLEAMNTV